ncbi:hypothetical protein [Streptomyces anulatus]|uniref:hypothetical protein n=1 Tax=Streptomyces anulatus TaxID=1892 RepID=UPI003722C28C
MNQPAASSRNALPGAIVRRSRSRAVGAYTLSTLANRLTGAPVDAPLAAFA